MPKAADLGMPKAFYHLGQLTCEYYIHLEELIPLPADVDRKCFMTVDFFDKIAAQNGLWNKYDSIAEYFLNDITFHKNYPLLREEKIRLLS